MSFRTAILLFLIFSACFWQANLAYGDTFIMGYNLYPVMLKLNSKEVINCYIDLYPYVEMVVYNEQPIFKDTELLPIILNNYPDADNIRVYTELVTCGGYNFVSERGIRSVKKSQLKEISIRLAENEVVFRKPLFISSNAELSDAQYQMLQKKTVSTLGAMDVSNDIFLVSTNPEINQLDLYIYSHLIVHEQVGDYLSHPCFHQGAWGDISSNMYLLMEGIDKQAASLIASYLDNSRKHWLLVMQKLKNHPCVLPESIDASLAKLQQAVTDCDAAESAIWEIQKATTPVPDSQKDAAMDILFKACYPEIQFTPKEEISWAEYLFAKGVFLAYLQID